MKKPHLIDQDDLLKRLKLERDTYKQDKREAKRFSASWHHADGAVFALEFAIGIINGMETK